MATKKKQENSDDQEDTHAPIFNIAKWVILFSFSIIGVLGFSAIIAIALDSDEKKVIAIKDVLSILLPVIGAWAGTVIAYYFSRENFESATKNTKSLVRQLTPTQILESTLFKDVMIPINQATKLFLTEDESKILIKPDILDAVIDAENRNRLPVLSDEGRMKYMLHRSLLDRFLIKFVTQGKKIEEISLANFLTDTEFKKIARESFGTLSQESTLAEAKALMDKAPYCSDVFATENGREDGKVVGWVTNGIILSHSNA